MALIPMYLWLLASGRYTEIVPVVMAVSTAWGMFIAVFLLGFGLVDVPTTLCWHEPCC